MEYTEKEYKEDILKVTRVRYFETHRGWGYECRTNVGGMRIINEGRGGCTWLQNHSGIKLTSEDYEKYTEAYLESLIDSYEATQSK